MLCCDYAHTDSTISYKCTIDILSPGWSRGPKGWSLFIRISLSFPGKALNSHVFAKFSMFSRFRDVRLQSMPPGCAKMIRNNWNYSFVKIMWKINQSVFSTLDMYSYWISFQNSRDWENGLCSPNSGRLVVDKWLKMSNISHPIHFTRGLCTNHAGLYISWIRDRVGLIEPTWWAVKMLNIWLTTIISKL